MTKKVAVLLSGCGFLDGAEIREAVLALTALDRQEAQVDVYSLNENQFHVINHTKQIEENSARNIMDESARIARGNIHDMKNLKALNYDALIIPGGFGVAKNFCSFAFKGPEAEVNPTVKNVIEDFYNNKKAIGAICIAPALISLVLGKKGVSVTIGNDKDTANAIENTGAKHIVREVHEINTDHEHKIVSTPAYMYGQAPLHKIQAGIELLVEKTLNL